jgi:hypothetical protein
MGTSYESLLLVADLEDVQLAVAAAGATGLVMSAGAGRTAVIVREGPWDTAQVDALARRLATAHGWAALTSSVYDSDAVILRAYEDGGVVREFVSDQAVLVDWFIDDDGQTKFRFAGFVYPADAPSPSGPLGADPLVFAPFGVGDVDLERLGACLRGEYAAGEKLVLAEEQHWAILEALNLDPRGLTVAFRHVDSGQIHLPGAVRV